MRISRWLIAAGVVALAAAIAVGTALGGSNTPKTHKAGFRMGLVSDVVGFNDSGFNKLQLAGLKRAAKKVHGVSDPLVSHSASDYQPNYTTAVHNGDKRRRSRRPLCARKRVSLPLGQNGLLPSC